MQRSETIKEIASALAKFQESVKQPAKSAENPFFKAKYIPLENVIEAINSYGPKQGLSFTQWPSVNEQGRVGVATLLMHSSGEWIEYDPIYMKSDKDTAQGAGSVISYLKRYSLSAVYGITSDLDDDGNDAAGNNNKSKQQSPPQNKPAAQSNTTSGPKLISDGQVKAIGTKTSIIAKSSGMEQKQVYLSATKHLKIVDKSTKELTAGEASKVIEYLASLE